MVRANDNRWCDIVADGCLFGSARCKLVVLAMETGGRWSEEAVQTLLVLAHSKARDAPPYSSLWPSCGNDDGRECWPLRALCPSRLPWWSLPETLHGVARMGETPLLAELFEGDPR